MLRFMLMTWNKYYVAQFTFARLLLHVIDVIVSWAVSRTISFKRSGKPHQWYSLEHYQLLMLQYVCNHRSSGMNYATLNVWAWCYVSCGWGLVLWIPHCMHVEICKTSGLWTFEEQVFICIPIVMYRKINELISLVQAWPWLPVHCATFFRVRALFHSVVFASCTAWLLAKVLLFWCVVACIWELPQAHGVLVTCFAGLCLAHVCLLRFLVRVAQRSNQLRFKVICQLVWAPHWLNGSVLITYKARSVSNCIVHAQWL